MLLNLLCFRLSSVWWLHRRQRDCERQGMEISGQWNETMHLRLKEEDER